MAWGYFQAAKKLVTRDWRAKKVRSRWSLLTTTIHQSPAAGHRTIIKSPVLTRPLVVQKSAFVAPHERIFHLLVPVPQVRGEPELTRGTIPQSSFFHVPAGVVLHITINRGGRAPACRHCPRSASAARSAPKPANRPSKDSPGTGGPPRSRSRRPAWRSDSRAWIRRARS